MLFSSRSRRFRPALDRLPYRIVLDASATPAPVVLTSTYVTPDPSDTSPMDPTLTGYGDGSSDGSSPMDPTLTGYGDPSTTDSLSPAEMGDTLVPSPTTTLVASS